MAAEVSNPQFHITGPIHHYIRRGLSNSIYYLGTAETSPQRVIQQMGKPVFNAIGGRMVPMQKLDHGEIVTLAVLMNRFSKAAVEAARTGGLAGTSGHILAPGWTSRWSRGSPKFGIRTVELWQVYENWFNPAFQSNGLEIGYYFPYFDIDQIGQPEADTSEEKLMLVGTAYPMWMGQASPGGVSGTDRTWKTYSSDPTDFPDDVRIPQ